MSESDLPGVEAVMAEARRAAGPQPRCETCGKFCYWTGWKWACKDVFTSDEGWSEHD